MNIDAVIFHLMAYWVPFCYILAFGLLAWKTKSRFLYISLLGAILVQAGTFIPYFFVDAFSLGTFSESGELIGMQEPTTRHLVIQYMQWIGAILNALGFLSFALLFQTNKKSKKSK